VSQPQGPSLGQGVSLQQTPSQTVGPFLAIGLPWPDGPFVVPEGTPGAITITGRVLDGAGDPLPDAMVETWQAAPDGSFGGAFRGFGRCGTTDDGAWEIVTLKPGRVGDGQAPHIDVTVLARGLLNRLVTRIYFADEPEANAADPVLGGLGEEQRATLVAEADGAGGYRFDIHLQGPSETTFFAV
jgi:protocatechuate 3,4-dioxygenase, alpha subunit